MSELIGRIVSGRYRVDEFIGKGGMAEVYKVWDQSRSVFLAMKVLNSDLAEDKIFLRRFKREAQTLAQLQHPNIVRSYGLEQSGDLIFLLMDYVDGTTLRKEIFQSKQPFSMQRILEILQPVCSALHYAHQSGFVHCDVKPANIMIHKNGMVCVADFGIARVAETTTVTMAGAGTPAYMPPELARGEMPVPQSDIYSLGIVLFEMLTGGERPFTGENANTTGTTSEKVRWEQMRLAPPPPSKFNRAVSPRMDQITLRCLEKQPAARYMSTLDLINELTMPPAPATAAAKPQTLRKKTVLQPEPTLPPEPIKIQTREAAASTIAPTGEHVYAIPPARRRPNLVWAYALIGTVVVAILLMVMTAGRTNKPPVLTTAPPVSPAPGSIAAAGTTSLDQLLMNTDGAPFSGFVLTDVSQPCGLSVVDLTQGESVPAILGGCKFDVPRSSPLVLTVSGAQLDHLAPFKAGDVPDAIVGQISWAEIHDFSATCAGSDSGAYDQVNSYCGFEIVSKDGSTNVVIVPMIVKPAPTETPVPPATFTPVLPATNTPVPVVDTPSKGHGGAGGGSGGGGGGGGGAFP